MKGFIHRQVSHDPQRKIKLAKNVNFKNVLTKSCLFKEYPTSGPYAVRVRVCGGVFCVVYVRMSHPYIFTHAFCCLFVI